VEMDLGIHPLAMRKIQSKHFLHERFTLCGAPVTLFPVNIFSFEVNVRAFGTSWGNLLLYLPGMKDGRKAVILNIVLEDLG
jgi:hypothetical protein